MHAGCYDAPFKELPSYRMRLEELCRLGFVSVGLAVDWDDLPSDQSSEDDAATGELLRANRAELRLHPDLAKLEQRGATEPDGAGSATSAFGLTPSGWGSET